MPWELIGLDKIKAAFSDMLRTNKVPHALLLLGAAGSGKLSLSLALAQALNCEAPSADFSPCLKCLSCRKTIEGIHPDVTILEPKGKLEILPIDDVRALRSALNFKPYEGRCKVAIIRGAHNFREESGGALLKTLEEPAPNTVIILNALSEAAVMTTLVSRCVRLKVPPVPRSLIIESLAKKGFRGEISDLMAGLSGGALGAALSLEPEKVGPVWNSLDQLLGKSGTKQAYKAAIDFSSKIVSDIDSIPKSEDTAKEKSNFLSLFINSLRLWWRDTAVLAATGDASLLQGPPPSEAQKKWAQTVTAKELQDQQTALTHLSYNLNRPIRLELLFENYWLGVLKFPQS
jgi:hypothetical protein